MRPHSCGAYENDTASRFVRGGSKGSQRQKVRNATDKRSKLQLLLPRLSSQNQSAPSSGIPNPLYTSRIPDLSQKSMETGGKYVNREIEMKTLDQSISDSLAVGAYTAPSAVITQPPASQRGFSLDNRVTLWSTVQTGHWRMTRSPPTEFRRQATACCAEQRLVGKGFHASPAQGWK